MNHVLVIGKTGTGLMPCNPRKARILLQQKKAEVVRRVPFTIRLLYKTGSTTQQTELGIDTDSQHIGAAVVSNGHVLGKCEFELRSTMEKRALIETRKAFRRGRRYRNTPYRKPKYPPRTKRVYHEEKVKRRKTVFVDGRPKTVIFDSNWEKQKVTYPSNRSEGWLPDSVQSKYDQHERIIRRFLEALPKDTHLTIEGVRFDAAKIKDSDIGGEAYQLGRMYGHENRKAYVFSRDGYACKVCGKHGGQQRADGSIVKLIAHHIDFKAEAATDNPDRMITVCNRCHTAQAHEPGGILYRWMCEGKKLARGMRDMAFVNIITKRLKVAFPKADFTFGHITNTDRTLLGLKKSHANDAVAIALHQQIINSKDVPVVMDSGITMYYKQIRRKKRSLHEANPRKGRNGPNRSAKRNAKNRKCSHGLCLNDSVLVNGKRGWVQSFTGSSGCRIVDQNGEYLRISEKYTNIAISRVTFLHHNNWRAYAVKE